MAVVPGDKVGTPPVWQEYKKTIKEAEGKEVRALENACSTRLTMLPPLMFMMPRDPGGAL